MSITNFSVCPICGTKLKHNVHFDRSYVYNVNCPACGRFAIDEDYVCLSLLSQSAQNSLQISANLHTQIEETLDDVAPCLRKLADTDSLLASSLLDQLLFE